MRFLFKTFLTGFMLLALSTSSSFAQSTEEINPKLMKEVEELYSRKEEVRDFIFLLMERKLAGDMIVSLEAQGFPEKEIQKVLEGGSFEDFSRRVLTHPVTVRHVDRFIENTLHPEKLRKIFLRRKAEWRTAQTTEIVLMLRRLMMERQLRLDAPKEEEPPFWNKLLAGFYNLFEERVN